MSNNAMGKDINLIVYIYLPFEMKDCMALV